MGNELRVSIPPTSYAGQMIVRGLYLAACLPVAAIVFLSVAFIVSDVVSNSVMDRSSVGVSAIIACLFLLLLLILIGKLIHHIRNEQLSSSVTAGIHGLEVRTPWLPNSQPFQVPRENIVDLRVNPGGAAFSPACFLEITTRDDRILTVRLPWPKRHPMIELEDNLCDILGLSK